MVRYFASTLPPSRWQLACARSRLHLRHTMYGSEAGLSDDSGVEPTRKHFDDWTTRIALHPDQAQVREAPSGAFFFVNFNSPDDIFCSECTGSESSPASPHGFFLLCSLHYFSLCFLGILSAIPVFPSMNFRLDRLLSRFGVRLLFPPPSAGCN